MRVVIYGRVLFFCVLIAVAASLLFAQSTSPGMAKELLASWNRAAADIIDVAEAMPEDRYDFKPTPEVRTFADQLVHVAGIVQRFIDDARGIKGEPEHPHGRVAKAEVVRLLKDTFQAGGGVIASLTDAQAVEQVKLPFGDRMASRYGFWTAPLQQVANHYGQLVVYLRLNGIVPPATARRSR